MSRPKDMRGFTRSFYVSRHDTDFYMALLSMLNGRGLEISPFVLFCLKYVVLKDGEDFFEDFKKHYHKIIEEKLEDTYVKYKGKSIKLGDLIEDELLKEKSYVKI